MIVKDKVSKARLCSISALPLTYHVTLSQVNLSCLIVLIYKMGIIKVYNSLNYNKNKSRHDINKVTRVGSSRISRVSKLIISPEITTHLIPPVLPEL